MPELETKLREKGDHDKLAKVEHILRPRRRAHGAPG